MLTIWQCQILSILQLTRSRNGCTQNWTGFIPSIHFLVCIFCYFFSPIYLYFSYFVFCCWFFFFLLSLHDMHFFVFVKEFGRAFIVCQNSLLLMYFFFVGKICIRMYRTSSVLKRMYSSMFASLPKQYPCVGSTRTYLYRTKNPKYNKNPKNKI